jgi:hypothetical protein
VIYAPFFKMTSPKFNNQGGQDGFETMEMGGITFLGGTLGGSDVNYMGHEGTIIIGSKSANIERRRMLAHELGHLLMKGQEHASPEPPDSATPGDPRYPWHRLMNRTHSDFQRDSTRLSPAETKALFSPRGTYLK